MAPVSGPLPTREKIAPAWLKIVMLGGFFLFGALFLVNSLTRTRNLSADSFNYIDVARNLAGGRGLLQSTLVITRPLKFYSQFDTTNPFITQPPAYPILVAFFHQLNQPVTDAALLVAGLGYFAALAFGFLLAGELYGATTAWLAVGLLIALPAIKSLARWAWSESLCIAFLLLALWLLARVRRDSVGKHPYLLTTAAGLAGGLAFATRYALLPIMGVGLSYLCLENVTIKPNLKINKKFWPLSGCFLAGWSIPALLILGHNLLSSGRFLPANLPSDQSFLTNLTDAISATIRTFLPFNFQPAYQIALFALTLLLIGSLAWRSGRRGAYLKDILLDSGRYLLAVWSVVYIGFVVLQRSLIHFDVLDVRLLAPAAATLIVLAAALLAGLVEPRTSQSVAPVERLDKKPVQLWAVLCAGLLLCVAIGQELVLLTRPAAPTLDQTIQASPRLAWIAAHTTAQDLIIGDTTNDIPFFFGRPAAVSFSAYPYTHILTPETLQEVVTHYCPVYQNFYLILRKHAVNQLKFRQQYGRFVHNLVYKPGFAAPGVELVADLDDGRVFKLDYCGE